MSLSSRQNQNRRRRSRARRSTEAADGAKRRTDGRTEGNSASQPHLERGGLRRGRPPSGERARALSVILASPGPGLRTPFTHTQSRKRGLGTLGKRCSAIFGCFLRGE